MRITMRSQLGFLNADQDSGADGFRWYAWQVGSIYDESWSPILFEVKRSNVKVGVGLHSSECQSSNYLYHCVTVATLQLSDVNVRQFYFSHHTTPKSQTPNTWQTPLHVHRLRTLPTDTGYEHHQRTPPTDKNLPHPSILTCRDVGDWRRYSTKTAVMDKTW